MKHVKMVLYGEPGVGKSVFALGAPDPFFITTDGNYEFLEDFGAKEDGHIQVYTWAEMKKAFADAIKSTHQTIIVDLVEDAFKWCEYEYCKRNGFEHVSDIGFGKGYDITRNEFFIEISKLLASEHNVILIMHGLTYTVKDRRGVDHTKYGPTNRIPDKVLDMIEGRVRYFVRAYLKADEIDGKLIKKRYLSIVPKENEYGISRGLNEAAVPTDIPLDFKTFAEVIGLSTSNKVVKPVETINDIKLKPQAIFKPVEKVEEKPIEKTVVEEKLIEKAIEQFKSAEKVVEEPKVEEKVVEPVVEKPVEQPKQEQASTNVVDKAAALRAKIAALKARQRG